MAPWPDRSASTASVCRAFVIGRRDASPGTAATARARCCLLALIALSALCSGVSASSGLTPAADYSIRTQSDAELVDVSRAELNFTRHGWKSWTHMTTHRAIRRQRTLRCAAT
jgi:hypothetical protein